MEDFPSSAHFIYIPGILILGLVTGFIWGARLTREQVALEAKREQEREQKREQKREERLARRAEGAAAVDKGSKPPGGG